MTKATTEVRVPPLYCPIPSRAHWAVERLRRRSLAWMSRFGFCDNPTMRARVIGCNAAEAMALMLPNAEEDRLQVLTDWTYLLFLLDDFVYRMDGADTLGFVPVAARLLRTQEAPGSGLLDDGPFSEAALDIAMRLTPLLAPVQRRRWVEAIRRWLTGTMWEKGVVWDGVPLTLNEYAALRMDSSAGAAWLEMCEIFRPSEVSGWEAVLAHQDGLGWPEALRRAIRLRDHLMRRFCRLRDDLVPDTSPSLLTYLRDAGQMIRGHLDWHFRPCTHRYSDPDGTSHGALKIIGQLADTCCPEADEPLPIPSIAWWWKV